MPRFINTWTGEFESHNDPAEARYAILSHTWRSPSDGGEQTYSDVLKLQAEIVEYHLGARSIMFNIPPDYDPAHDLPLFFYHPRLSDKIAHTCKVAREEGFGLLWIDASCIDKSSSAELAEAINSMFEWYRLSDVCYAYLEDVDNDEDLEGLGGWQDQHRNSDLADSDRTGTSHNAGNPSTSFRDSRWHTRGWTLQELLAAARVIFLTKRWAFLGTKVRLAAILEEITGIDFDILTGHAPIDSASVARRMSWAASRETTRIEDRAYSLLGIFGVHMAPIYGEGENAFLRLQEEILRTIPDQTIFAWGNILSTPALLASSPSAFYACYDINVLQPGEFASRLRIPIEDVPPLHAVFTPQGVRIKLLCVDLSKVPSLAASLLAFDCPLDPIKLCKDCRTHSPAHLLAFLQCETDNRALVGLPLHRPPPGSGAERGLFVGRYALCTVHRNWRYIDQERRTAALKQTGVQKVLAHGSSLSVCEVAILHHHTFPPESKLSQGYIPRPVAIDFWPSDNSVYTVNFKVDSDCIRELDVLGFRISPLQVSQSFKQMIVSFTLDSYSVLRPWTTSLPRQRIAVAVSVTPSADTTRNSKALATFSVKNFGFYDSFDPDCPDTSLYATSNIRDTLSCLPPSYVVDRASGEALREGICSSEFDTQGLTLDTLAVSHFAIYAGLSLPEEDGEPKLKIRWLRVLLRYSKDSYTDLCIVVELSAPCKFRTRRGLSTARNSRGVTVNTGPDKAHSRRLISPLAPQLTVQTLSDKLEALTLKNADYASQIAALSSQNAALSRQMAAILEHLRISPTQTGSAAASSCEPRNSFGNAREPDELEVAIGEMVTGMDGVERPLDMLTRQTLEEERREGGGGSHSTSRKCAKH